MNMEFERKLPIPMVVKQRFPTTADEQARLAAHTRTLEAILSGRDERLLLIVGPCSADNESAVLDYASRLRRLQEAVKDRLLLVPRVFTNKPRTTGAGYKGLLHQPDAAARPDLYEGILAVRRLHLRVLRETGFFPADELLYPENHRYVDDLLGYVTVGARSVEDQQHRLTASGIEVPVGMKNPTAGTLSVMLNAIAAAQTGHSFLYRGWAVHSKGNPFAHAILRGYRSRHGEARPNYLPEALRVLAGLYAESGLQNPAVLIDANHDNSDRDPLRQPEIIRAVQQSRRADPALRGLVKGYLIESYLEDGAQPPGGSVYGRSITDPCLGWEKTEALILRLAE